MTNLLWPGDHRAGPLLRDAALWHAMVRVEHAWLRALGKSAIIPSDAACDLTGLVHDSDREGVAVAADDGGNPVITLVALLRQRAPEPTQHWIHRGLTSQDVVDSALMLALRDALRQLRTELGQQLRALAGLADAHRDTGMLARTLTQPAVPMTFGAKVATWLNGITDAADAITRLRTPIQIGGAAGTLAASTELATLARGGADAAGVVKALVDDAADTLRLDRSVPWHTNRSPVTAIADALVRCTDAWGRIASDVVTLNRPEIGELAEPSLTGRGGSSAMPGKENPVLSVLLRRAAVTAPPMAAVLHTTAAFTNDERADGAWHAEWDTLRVLARRALVAASHATDLVTGLRVNVDRMAANLASASVSGEQDSTAALVQKQPTTTYLGACDYLIDRALDRAAQSRGELH